MDKEKLTRSILMIIASCIFIFSITIGFYYVFHPHYFYTIEEPSYINITGLNTESISKEPILDCYDKFDKDSYTGTIVSVPIYFKKCYMYYLPINEPYIKEKNIYLYNIITYQWIFLLFYLLLFFLDESHKYYYKRKSYIRILIRKYKH